MFPDTRLEEIHRRLLAYYGQSPEREVWDPLKQFIYSLLSSRTKTEISVAVTRHLEDRFRGWENVRDASIAEIEDAIRAVTFPEPKAVNLKRALEQITQRCGSLSLDFLKAYRTDKIRSWLERFDGVGVKTSAAVVNFSTLRRRAICVDSHHLRVTQRLGLVGRSADARETENRLMEMAPVKWSAEMLDEHHSLIKIHGQQLCPKNNPRCRECPLLDLCLTGTEMLSNSSRGKAGRLVMTAKKSAARLKPTK
ncbi:endonuclease III [Granulicella sp. S190]|uniref:endonuclease III domain-containing protein n=1 Tax=Granulicella sp. S190 TaxID=1747226 RepID=UPI0020B12B4D|nr:iron-sulfur cluster loop [Granulicella sp. S190]